MAGAFEESIKYVMRNGMEFYQGNLCMNKIHDCAKIFRVEGVAIV